MREVTVRDVAPAFGMGTLGLTTKGLTTLSGLPESTDLKILYLQYNALTSFDHLGSQPSLKELNVEGNKIASFRGAAPLPKLEFLVLKGNPVANHPFYRIMSLMAFGSNIRRIDGTVVLNSERDLAKSMGSRAAAAVRLGWLMDTRPRTQLEYAVMLDEWEKNAITGSSSSSSASQTTSSTATSSRRGEATPSSHQKERESDVERDEEGYLREQVFIKESELSQVFSDDERRTKERDLVKGLQREVSSLRQKLLTSKSYSATPPKVFVTTPEKGPSPQKQSASPPKAASPSKEDQQQQQQQQQHDAWDTLPVPLSLMTAVEIGGVRLTKTHIEKDGTRVSLPHVVEAFFEDEERVLRLVCRSGRVVDLHVSVSGSDGQDTRELDVVANAVCQLVKQCMRWCKRVGVTVEGEDVIVTAPIVADSSASSTSTTASETTSQQQESKEQKQESAHAEQPAPVKQAEEKIAEPQPEPERRPASTDVAAPTATADTVPAASEKVEQPAPVTGEAVAANAPSAPQDAEPQPTDKKDANAQPMESASTEVAPTETALDSKPTETETATKPAPVDEQPSPTPSPDFTKVGVPDPSPRAAAT
jgi:hypothetical protein